MACTVNTLTFVKDKDFGIKLESATPAVDLPVGGVDRREVEKDGLCPLHHYNSVHRLISLLASTTFKLYKKRGVIKGDLQYLQ